MSYRNKQYHNINFTKRKLSCRRQTRATRCVTPILLYINHICKGSQSVNDLQGHRNCCYLIDSKSVPVACSNKQHLSSTVSEIVGYYFQV